jgi:hypothetical protein
MKKKQRKSYTAAFKVKIPLAEGLLEKLSGSRKLI